MKRSIVVAGALCLSLSGNAECKYHLGGRLFIDGGLFTYAPSDYSPTVGITDLRLTGKVSFSEGWFTKLDIGFAKNKVTLKDAFVQKRWNDHIFRVGYMLGMFSLDQSSSTNDYLFLTGANIAESFYPDRRIGISYTYSSLHYYTSVGVFCGDGLNYSTKIQQGNNATLRFVYRPLNESDRLVHIGSGVFYKTPDKDKESKMRSISMKTRGVTYLSIPYMLSTVIDNVKTQYQWNIESIFHYNRCFIQAEYLQMWINRTRGIETYTARGGYVEGGYLLKGKSLAYDAVDALPICPSDPHSLCVFARFNYTDLNDSSLKGGKQYDISWGINYYLNSHIIFRFNYSHIWLDTFSVIGKENLDMWQTRIQVKF